MTRHLTDDTIQDFFDDVLDPPRRREAERHLARCTECASVLDELTSVRALLRSLPRSADRTPASPVFGRGRPSRHRSRRSAAVVSRRRGLARATGLAAAFAIGIAIGAAVAARRDESSARTMRDPGAMELATEVQRTGTAYAAAVAALAGIDESSEAVLARSQGREAALSILYAATLAYARLEPSDPNVGRILEALETARRRIREARPAAGGS